MIAPKNKTRRYLVTGRETSDVQDACCKNACLSLSLVYNMNENYSPVKLMLCVFEKLVFVFKTRLSKCVLICFKTILKISTLR
jgi:hypothetical protein